MQLSRVISFIFGLFTVFLSNMIGGAVAPALAESIKVFWVDSYNSGYEWSDGIERGIRNGLKRENVEFGVFHMDTKACKSSECLERAGLRAKAAVEAFNPDVLIASDDNAQKYLIVPHYKDTKLQVVFCGVNWDASGYGYPTKNVTGMIEVDLVKETVEHMRRYATGDRIGYISGDTVSDRKIITWLNKHFFDMKMKAVRVKDFNAFKKRFIELQKEVDMLFIRNYAGIEGWESVAAKKFIAQNLRIPTGSNNDFMAPYVIFTLGKIPEEQGRYAAETALKIVKGARPTEFKVVANRQARLTVNVDMALRARIVLPVSVLKVATVIGQDAFDQQQSVQDMAKGGYAGKRIIWIDSYHDGYEWSDGIGQAIREVLFETGVELKVVHMDTKRNNTDLLMKAAAIQARAVIDAFNPDVVIASDDNAQKYLIVPFYKNTDLPVVFCGVNWEAGTYGYPASNVTGMVEINPIKELIALLRPFARGDRIGYLAGNVVVERKMLKIYNDQIFGGRMKSYLVNSQSDFENKFLKAQQEVDILFFSNYTGIKDWNAQAARQFVFKHTSIPSGSDNGFMEHFVTCTLAKSSREQGRYAALTALKILDGQSPADIPLIANRRNRLTVNLQLAKKADIVFPISMLKKARVIGRKVLD